MNESLLIVLILEFPFFCRPSHPFSSILITSAKFLSSMMSSSSSYSSGFPLQMSSILKSVFIVLIIFSGSAQPQGAVENEKVEIQLVVKEHRLVDMVCRCNDSSHLKGILEEQMKCMDTYEKTEMKTAGQTEVCTLNLINH